MVGAWAAAHSTAASLSMWPRIASSNVNTACLMVYSRSSIQRSRESLGSTEEVHGTKSAAAPSRSKLN
eukprot:72953-Prorocentrum_minimum.AAC.2